MIESINKQLFRAIHCNELKVIKKLPQISGFDINSIIGDNKSALMVVCESGTIESVKLLLKIPGINVNYKNNVGDTALIIASREGKIEIVELLKTYVVKNETLYKYANKSSGKVIK